MQEIFNMTDFTKEELKLIIDGVLYLRSGCTNYAMDSEKLKIKIQSMIDNYCEHEHGAYVAKVSHPVDVHIWNQPANIVECP